MQYKWLNKEKNNEIFGLKDKLEINPETKN